MKISFPKYALGAFPFRKRDTQSIIWSMVIGFFIGIVGSYLLKHNFGLLGLSLLGMAGIVMGRAVMALLTLDKTRGPHRVPIKQSLPRITSGWDYRPKAVSRRDAAFDGGLAGTAGVVGSSSSVPDETDDVWFNFANSKPAVDEATEITPQSGDVCGVSAYD